VADGRSVRLTVTDEGAARVAQWRDIRAELAGRALERLPATDRRAISAAVPALGRLAEQMAVEIRERALVSSGGAGNRAGGTAL
jgi:DNA-binding MarR family transcriptional regulator